MLRYGPGDLFRRHRDRYSHPENSSGRRLSLVAFLTGQRKAAGFTGGHFCVYVRDRGGEACVRMPGAAGASRGSWLY